MGIFLISLKVLSSIEVEQQESRNQNLNRGCWWKEKIGVERESHWSLEEECCDKQETLNSWRWLLSRNMKELLVKAKEGGVDFKSVSSIVLLSVFSQRHLEIILNMKEQTSVPICLKDYSVAKN